MISLLPFSFVLWLFTQHGIPPPRKVPWTQNLRCWDTEHCSPFSSTESGICYYHLNVCCLTLRLGCFYVQRLIIRGGEGEQGSGVGVLVIRPLQSHRTKEFIEKFTTSSSCDCHILTGLHLGVGKHVKRIASFYFSISFLKKISCKVAFLKKDINIYILNV